MESNAPYLTVLQHLALIYIALAHATDEDLSRQEINTIARKLKEWETGDSEVVLRAIDDAMNVYVQAGAEQRVIEAIKYIRLTVAVERRQKILDDLVSIAMADDRFISEESSFIRDLVRAWEVYPGRTTSDRPASWSLLNQDESNAGWNLVHDVTLVYVAIAHHTDGQLTDHEMNAIQKKLGEWLPDATEDEILDIIRQVTTTFAQESIDREFASSVQAIKKALPVSQLAALYDDLIEIATADGRIHEMERSLIADLSKEWSVSIA